MNRKNACSTRAIEIWKERLLPGIDFIFVVFDGVTQVCIRVLHFQVCVQLRANRSVARRVNRAVYIRLSSEFVQKRVFSAKIAFSNAPILLLTQTERKRERRCRTNAPCASGYRTLTSKKGRWKGRYDVNTTHAALRSEIGARGELRDAKRWRGVPLVCPTVGQSRGLQNARARARGRVDVRTRANQTKKNVTRAHWRSFRHQWMFVLDRDRCICSSRVKEVRPQTVA